MKAWSTSIEAKLLTRSKDAAEPADRTDQRTWILGTHQKLRLRDQGILRSGSVRYEYERARDRSPAPSGSRSDSHAVDVELLTAPVDAVRLLPSLRLVTSRRGLEPATVQRTYAMQAQHETGRGRLRLALDVRRTEHPVEAWWAAALTSRLALAGLAY